MDNYHYVYHKETDEQAFRLQEGKFEGVVWNYSNVKLPIHDENGELLSPEEVESIPLTFEYEILYNKNGVVTEDNHKEFEFVIGDILMNVIEEGLEHDQITVDPENRNKDSEQLDS
jgi:hypothetical protein